MPGGDVAERQRRAEVDPACRIMPAHDAGHVATCRVEPGDGLAMGVEHLCLRVDPEPGKGAEAARLHFHGIKRAGLYWGNAGVGKVRRIALFAVVGRCAATEQRVFAKARMRVVVINSAAQPAGIDTAGAGQFFKGVAGFQIAAADKS